MELTWQPRGQVSLGEAGQLANDKVAIAHVAVDLPASYQDNPEHAEYPGFRISMKANVASWAGTVTWDVSTGDPIVPAPRMIKLPRILGEPIEVLGYAPETSIAEKA